MYLCNYIKVIYVKLAWIYTKYWDCVLLPWKPFLRSKGTFKIGMVTHLCFDLPTVTHVRGKFHVYWDSLKDIRILYCVIIFVLKSLEKTVGVKGLKSNKETVTVVKGRLEELQCVIRWQIGNKGFWRGAK